MRCLILSQCKDFTAGLMGRLWGPDDGTSQRVLDVLKTA